MVKTITMKQTAVEWLEQELKERYGSINLIEPLFKQANEMFEQQIEDAWKDGFFEKSDSSKIYYHKTFKIE
jgi:hypothetical protein